MEQKCKNNITARYIVVHDWAERGIRIFFFSEAVYSDHKQGGDYNERAEGEKGKDDLRSA